ncbi:MAG: hypothetical protein EBW20_08830 [Betaproteobacteria bacterium]|nr:hypothetical protein [Betaproteobacteria bacterium]
MFQGTSSLHLDAKGRVTVPSRHRDVLLAQCEGRLTLTRPPVCTLTPPLLSQLPPPGAGCGNRLPPDTVMCTTFCHFFLLFATLRKRVGRVKSNDPE